ncbi:hypothetical protein [Conexibacter sp. S30A1]|uniref:hypothetical protein n=1 Tax=Conexibacter sp. S30A1 TaxID=2937800 RepID=UPI00200BC276|nr:hypothetical protein [Conexibacter sp. S30A1]
MVSLAAGPAKSELLAGPLGGVLACVAAVVLIAGHCAASETTGVAYGPSGAINGDSYRMRAHSDASNALRPAITGGEKP